MSGGPMTDAAQADATQAETAATDTWAPVPAGSGFGPANLPYGVATLPTGRTTVVARIGDAVLPVADALPEPQRHLVEAPTLNPFLAAGPAVWRDTRARLRDHLADRAVERPLVPVADVELLLPMAVGDYVDFYSSIHHATNLGRIFRPNGDALLPNWRHLPVGYHGRSATICVSGTPITRPTGLVATGAAGTGDGVRRQPSAALDLELEVGFVVGPGNEPGRPIAPDDAAEHVFGVVLVNDWSARDLQAFEYQPLGPFLGKSFATTVSPWVVPLDALAPHLVPPPAQDPVPDPLLRAERPWGLDLDLEVALNGTTITHTNLADLYWTFAQQLAHLTSNGATTRPGDLFASGTVSGPEPGSRGSLIEATWRGRDPLRLDDGGERTWLLDGDTVTISGRGGGRDGTPLLDLGDATGTILPARAEALGPATATAAAATAGAAR
ncbi:MAG TPA: fumarylacetoacetase [Aquihabitans sp.]|nr:fumarylacetoacetase [Aquihabitans sp.]